MDTAECVDTPSGPTPRILVEYKYPEVDAVKVRRALPLEDTVRCLMPHPPGLDTAKVAYPFNHHKVDKAGRPMCARRPAPQSLPRRSPRCPRPAPAASASAGTLTAWACSTSRRSRR